MTMPVHKIWKDSLPHDGLADVISQPAVPSVVRHKLVAVSHIRWLTNDPAYFC